MNPNIQRAGWLFGMMLLVVWVACAAKAAESIPTGQTVNEPSALLEGVLGKERFSAVLPFARELAERTHTRQTAPDTNTVSALNFFGGLQYSSANYSKAAVFYCECLAVCERVYGPDHSATALVLNDLGVVCQQLGNHVKALQLHRRSLAIYEKVSGVDNVKSAMALSNLAVDYQMGGNFAQAEPLFERVIRITEVAKGRNHADTALALNNLALLHEQMGAYAKAEPLLVRSLSIYEQTRGPEHPETAMAMKNMALLHFHTGDFVKAGPLLVKSLDIIERKLGPEHPLTATLLISLGEFYRNTGDFERAEPACRRGLVAFEKALGSKNPETLKAMNNLGLLYETIGQYDKAEPLLRVCLQGYEEIFTAEHPDTVMAMNNLAMLYRSMADYAKAETLWNRSVRILEKVLGPDHPDTARTLNNLALLHEQTGDYAKAEPLLLRSLKISEEVSGHSHPRTAIILANLAYFYSFMQRYGEAEPLLDRSLRICEQNLGTNHPSTAAVLNNLGLLYSRMQEFKKAEPLFERSLAIREETLGPFHQETAGVLENLSVLKLDLRQFDAALGLERRSRVAAERNLGLVLSFASERQRLSYQDNRDLRLLDIMATLGSATDVAELTLRTKGIVLDSLLEDAVATRASKDPAILAVHSKLQVAGRRLIRLEIEGAQRGQIEEHRQRQAERQNLEGQVEELQAASARHIAALGKTRRSLRVTVPEVQEALARDTVVLEFVRFSQYLGKGRVEPRYGVIVIPGASLVIKGAKAGEPVWIPLVMAETIEQNLRDYRAMMRGERKGDSALLRSLYSQLAEPILSQLPQGITSLIISADGELNFLSFATLVDGQDRFLAERYSIRYVASGRDLVNGPSVQNRSRSYSAFADPAFAASPTVMGSKSANDVQLVTQRADRRDYEGMTLGALPNTSLEAQFLRDRSSAWQLDGSVHVGAEASESAVKAVKSPYILHLATHGFFLPDNSITNRLPIHARLTGEQPKPVVIHNPMQRSGLAFAGAQLTLDAWKRGEVPDTENDGILMAQEVGTMDLKDTWLVVLSACDTGIGEARNGEGVLGLRRGFVQAGAQNLLMTLWPISDKWSVDIMKAFYEKAMATGDAPQAMADVQAEWLARLRKEKGVLIAARIAGPFVLSTRGRQSTK